MSKIDELIQELCPDGVAHVKLGELALLVRGNGLPKSDFAEEGIGAIHYGQIYTLYKTSTELTKSFVSPTVAAKLVSVEPGDLIITNTSENLDDVGKAVAWLGKENIVTGGHATVIKHGENPKYLAYWFQTPDFYLQKKKLAKGTKVIDVSAKDLEKVIVPVPPRRVQDQIVSVLDAFSSLEAELEAELEARRKQYEHYRYKLLSAHLPKDVEFKTLGELLGPIPRGKRLTKSNLSAGGSIPVFHGGLNPIGYHDESNTPGETVMVINVGASSGSVGWSHTPFWCSDGCFALPHSKEISSRYLYYCASLNEQFFMDKVRKAGIPTLASESVLALVVPVLPMPNQIEIVGILDNFSELTTNLSMGLPAELSARRKQYEYYRDKLLTFKELAA